MLGADDFVPKPPPLPLLDEEYMELADCKQVHSLDCLCLSMCTLTNHLLHVQDSDRRMVFTRADST